MHRFALSFLEFFWVCVLVLRRVVIFLAMVCLTVGVGVGLCGVSRPKAWQARQYLSQPLAFQVEEPQAATVREPRARRAVQAPQLRTMVHQARPQAKQARVLPAPLLQA